ncbi:Frataxin [Oopsacas minuta]|uniref:ferroxidase n=1 Tax=Oopsacas minuta TaxID=111878 RepID=A0AAV7KFA2_9METZ|nr:Frataxin [Oopsacas minuta]
MYYRYLKLLNSTLLPIKSYRKVHSISQYQNPTKFSLSTPSIQTITPNKHYTAIPTLSIVQFEQISENTLQSLTEYFDSLPSLVQCSKQYDVNFADGVLTIIVNDDIGTYVINKQTPNRQIWLSSPISGPKRFDLVNTRWIYLHDNSCLHDLLQREFSDIFKIQLVLDKTRSFI